MQSGAKKFNLKLKGEETPIGPSEPGFLKFHIPDKNQTEQLVSNLKLVLKENSNTKKIKRKKYNSNNYFGVKNHIDLFEVGKYYTNIVQSGSKSLAFNGHQASVHHTILGLASFFNYHKSMKATIFIEKFEGSELSKFLVPTHIEMEMVTFDDEEESFEIYSCDGVDVVEMHKLKHFAIKMGMDAFNEFLNKIVKDSEIVFWDLPEITTINKEREFYFPILNVINSISLIVNTGLTKINQIKEMTLFANKYQISVEGVLMYKNQ